MLSVPVHSLCQKVLAAPFPEILMNFIFQGCTTWQFSITASVMVRQRVQNMIGMGRPTIAGPVLVDLTAIMFTDCFESEMFQGKK